MSMRTHLALAILLVPASTAAQPAAPATPAADDGYCDFVEGAAGATAATLQAPQLFGQFGYIEQPAFAETPGTDTNNLRLIGGVRYSLTNILVGSATKRRAAADCRRHKAMATVKGGTQAAATAARLKVLDDAQAEADKILAQVTADLEARRMTAPEAMSTRLRVDELRGAAANARRELASLAPPSTESIDTLLTAYRSADADVEASEARLRTMSAYDVSVRAGADRFLDGPNPTTNFFGVVQVEINIGALWLGGSNDRAAAGRRRYVVATQEAQQQAVAVPAEQLRAMLEVEAQRATQVAALVADLQQQLDALARIESDESKRFRQTVWFDWVKAKAELAYLQTHAESLRQALGSTKR
jgi:hypothetical protein